MMFKISTFFHNNEKWLTPVVLFGGFILDNLTLRRSDLLAENLLLGVYFAIVFFGILYWHKIESKKQKTISNLEAQSFVFLLMQFSFGGLFSSLTVFYIKSASFFASWPFLLLLFGGMVATEYFKKHFTQFIVQLGTLYILLFTYFIVLVPLAVRAINSWVFILSGILSLVAIFTYVLLFKSFVPSLIKHKQNYIVGIIGGIFILMNVFYFTNLIPPIPLALKDSGVYKSVTKTNSGYIFSNFPNRFSLWDLKQEYDIPSGSQVYFFSSVYAPIKFKEKIVHEWQKKNTKGEWVIVADVSFPIYGGSDLGYRGYTISQKVIKGEWRVLVKTEGGQVLGGESFIVR